MSRIAPLLALLLSSLLAAPAAAQTPVTVSAATLAEWQDKPLTWRTTGGGTLSATASLYANTSRTKWDTRVPDLGIPSSHASARLRCPSFSVDAPSEGHSNPFADPGHTLPIRHPPAPP